VEFNNNAPSLPSQSQSQSSLQISRPTPDLAAQAASVPALLQTIECAPEGHWDELRGGVSITPGKSTDSIFGTILQPTQVTPPWADFFNHLGAGGIQSLPARHDTMMRQVRDNGMTYNVYANADQPTGCSTCSNKAPCLTPWCRVTLVTCMPCKAVHLWEAAI
jgi:hypothetical protein